MNFPLRSLPFLVITNVIKNIDVKDIINMIRMSTKMRNLVKLSRVHIHLIVLGDDSIVFGKLSDPGRIEQVYLFLDPNSRESDTNIPFEPFVRRKSIYRCEENLEGYRKMLKDFVDIFIVPFADFDLRATRSVHICIQYLEYALGLGLKFKTVQATIFEEYTVDCGRRILLACAQATKLNIRLSGYSEEFSVLDRFREYNMELFQLTVPRNFKWFTVEHLFALVNCSNVRIYGVDLSDMDFNKFLKFWIAGAGKMRALDVDFKWTRDRENILINEQTVMNGIPRKETEQRGKFEIERSDGTKADVCCYDDRFTIGDIDPENLFD